LGGIRVKSVVACSLMNYPSICHGMIKESTERKLFLQGYEPEIEIGTFQKGYKRYISTAIFDP
jgi:hypothetical protein